MSFTMLKMGVVAAVAMSGGLVVAQVAGTRGETRSFVVGPNYMPVPEADQNSCPAKPQSAFEIFRDSLPAEQRAQYASPEKLRSLRTMMSEKLGFRHSPADDTLTPENIAERREKAGFPVGKGAISSYPSRHLAYDLCTNPEDFPSLATGHQEYRGSAGYGLNLDGKVSKDDLVGVDGARGVDNAWTKAMGCSAIARSTGEPKVGDNVIVSRQAPTLIEVSGIDNDQDDAVVEVTIYAAARALDLDAAGKALAWGSFNPVQDPHFTARVRGRIIKGVLTTDPFDVALRMHESIINTTRELRQVRLRAVLKSDGGLDGGFYGYQTLASLKAAYAQTSTVGLDIFSCPAEVKSLQKHADGFPDPKTRRNTAISMALHFKAVPAFIVHQQAAVTKMGRQ